MTKSLPRALAALLAVAGAAHAQGFGAAVAAGEEELLVGEALDARTPGSVYVYRPAAGGWTEAQRLRASDGVPADHFGRALALEGGSLLVGATVWSESRGAVYAFERGAGGEWREVQRWTPADAAPGDAFGRVAARQGDRALVSAWGHGEGRGAVYVLRRGRDGRWSQEAKLMAGDGAPEDFFGMSLALDGDRAAVGTTRKDDNRGAVYVFRRTGEGEWSQTARLAAPTAMENHRLGAALLFHGDRLLVGAPGADEFQGRVHVFEPGAEGWRHARALAPFDGGGAYAQFGEALARVGDALWVSAPGAGGFEGRIYVLRDESGDWSASTVLGAEGLREGAQFGAAMAVRGGRAVVGVTGADFGLGVAKVLERRSGSWAESGTLASEATGLDPIVGGRVDCDGGAAALFPCRDVELLSFLPVRAIGGGRGVEVNDVWGWTDPETGREYALVGRYDGTSFIDVSEPERPRYLGDLPLHAGATPNVWRDIKVHRDHAYIVADGAGEHGMQVFDLTRLRTVREPVTFEADAHYGGIASAHNIVIDTVSGFAFAVGSSGGGETCGGGLHMIDIRTPERPTFAGCFSDPRTGRASTGYSHDAQCVTYAGPDTEHRGRQICLGANETALSIADVTDKAAPVALARASYPNVAYAHQGWLTEDHRYFYMNDEGDESAGTVAGTRTLIWDVADLDDPVMVGEYIHDTPAIDHNLYVKGDLMYQSNYTSGLRILDVSEPEAPRLVAYFDTVPWGDDEATFDGSWSNYPYFASGTLVVTSGKEGVFLLKKRERPVLP